MVRSIPSRYRDTILDSINEAVFTVDLERRIKSFNSAAERLTSVPRLQALGRPCCDIFRASICQEECAIKQTLATGRPVVNATATVHSHDGRIIPVRISTALLKNNGGQVIGAVETLQDLSQVEQLRKELEAGYSFEDIIGHSPPMTQLYDILPQISESRSTVLLEGESGTGKELFARTIHHLSGRQGPFLAVNCAALPDSLLESELFGYMAGAFTDAKRDKPGRFALAQGGTILLDEIGDISPALQVRLLRVLQERTVEPLGSLRPQPVDVRVIASANTDLHKLVQAGHFRQDLFYRIRVVHLKLPPLRRRREDIPLLVEHLIGKFNSLQGKDIAGVSDRVMARLMEHHYPGNVRELENIIEQAFVLCRGGLIQAEHLPPELRPQILENADGPVTLKAVERAHIIEALRRFGGNRKQAAHALGIDPSTLYRKIKALDIRPPKGNDRASSY
jgi:PAS domain S-box-containing protein